MINYLTQFMEIFEIDDLEGLRGESRDRLTDKEEEDEKDSN